MIETFVKDGKTYTSIEDLFNWDKNPKKVMRGDYDRLRHQMEDLGVYVPLLVTPDGEVLGGNTRLRVLRDMEASDVWVSIVEPKNEAEKVKYALSSNDMVGVYDDEQLGDLLMGVDQEIDLKDYHVSLKDISLDKLMTQLGPGDESKKEDGLDQGFISCPKCGHIFDGAKAKAVVRQTN